MPDSTSYPPPPHPHYRVDPYPIPRSKPMADPVIPEPPASWVKLFAAAREVLVLILAAIAAIGSLLSREQAKDNGKEIQVVTQKQDVAVGKAAEVEKKVDGLNVVAAKTAAKVGAADGKE